MTCERGVFAWRAKSGTVTSKAELAPKTAEGWLKSALRLGESFRGRTGIHLRENAPSVHRRRTPQRRFLNDASADASVRRRRPNDDRHPGQRHHDRLDLKERIDLPRRDGGERKGDEEGEDKADQVLGRDVRRGGEGIGHAEEAGDEAGEHDRDELTFDIRASSASPPMNGETAHLGSTSAHRLLASAKRGQQRAIRRRASEARTPNNAKDAADDDDKVVQTDAPARAGKDRELLRIVSF